MQKLLHKKLGKSVKVTPLQLLLLVVVVAVGYKVIIMFIESLSQSNAGESAALLNAWRG